MAALSGLILLAAAATSKPTVSCYPYEPETVALTGTLARDQESTNTASTSQIPHDYFVLKLSGPICTAAKRSDEWNISRRGVKKVQLEPAGQGALSDDKLMGFLGKSVQCEGILFFAKNSTHHTAVVMSVKDCGLAH